jgi:hypothetical protein
MINIKEAHTKITESAKFLFTYKNIILKVPPIIADELESSIKLKTGLKQ